MTKMWLNYVNDDVCSSYWTLTNKPTALATTQTLGLLKCENKTSTSHVTSEYQIYISSFVGDLIFQNICSYNTNQLECPPPGRPD